ncbi:MAG: dihydrolipoyl dehydrogenase [Anaerolineae bacterium]
MEGDRVRHYDVIVIGSGSGATIVDNALYRGMRVAWVDRGPLGGTCLNVGCIPSKILIYPANRVVEIREAKKLGVEARITDVDFGAIMARMRRIVSHSQREIREGLHVSPNLDFYETEAHFVVEDQSHGSGHTVQAGDETITGRHVFIATGARPFIPPIDGLNDVRYLTNESVLDLRERPDNLAIVGGGYIAAEYAHFFAAMGTQVTIMQRNGYLVPDEEPKISVLLRKKLSERMKVFTHTEVIAVENQKGRIRVIGRDVDDGELREVGVDEVLVAAGRQSNADLLQVEKVGIETDDEGYIKVNEYLETGVDRIWALGDATGRHMFKHVANREASIAWHNFAHDHKVPMDYTAVPHAVFSYPQIASVGLTEAEAKDEFDILVGEAKYVDVAKGQAMMETDGFAKAVVERGSGDILGFHIIGPHAPMLIQEVVNAMANDSPVGWVGQGMHIHPALPEVVVRTLYSLREPRSGEPHRHAVHE